jgi:putative copper resistance protein D
VRLAVDLSGALTVGLCVTAAFLLPGDGRSVGAQGYRLLRRAGWCAAGWAVAAAALLVLSVSDVLGQPLSQVAASAVRSFALSVSLGQALTVQAGLALVVSIVARVGLSRAAA